MSHKRQYMATLCLSWIGLLVMTGCEYRRAGVDEKGKILLRSISFTGTPTEYPIIMASIADFNNAHPDIHVEHEIVAMEYSSKLLTAFAAGKAPDVFWVPSGSAQSYIIRGVLLEITPFIQADGIDLNDFYPATLDPYRLNGRYYGLPNDACSSVMFFNKEHYDAAGLRYPKDDWSWDEFVSNAKRLTRDIDGDGKTDQWGFVIPGDIWMLFPSIYSNGGRLFDPLDPDLPLFAKPEATQAVEMLLNLALKEKVAPLRGQMGDQDSKRGFQLGRISMMISGWWDMTDTEEYAPNMKYSVAPMPRIKMSETQIYSTGTGIYVNTPHPREAWEYVKFVTSSQQMLVRCKGRLAGPSRRSVGKDPYFNDRYKDKVFIATMETGLSCYGAHFDIMQDELIQARDRVLQELQTTEDSFKEGELNFLRRIKK
ncbi:MAG: sugar ABC transporter substrate-binding protein [Candidatus Sumerlaeota bacterium]|nr:sugar ABC transporter substrate-binding protein [Candidatus Sumerlaeota bacterium]